MHLRLASMADCKRLARVHVLSSQGRSDSFVDKLGEYFLRQFYWVALHDPYGVILCAVGDADTTKILGLSSGTLDAAETNRIIRRHWFRLALGAVFAFLRHPSL